MIVVHFKGGGPLDGGTAMAQNDQGQFYVHRVSFRFGLEGQRAEWDELYARVGPIPVDKLSDADKRDQLRHEWFHYAGRRAIEGKVPS